MEALKQNAARQEERLSTVLQMQLMEKNIDHALSQLRTTLENMIFLDYETSQREKLEQRIWNSHQKVISIYRKKIKEYRKVNGKKKPVELRKLVSGFTNILKSASKFYRSFIQRLACHFRLSELEPVLKQFRLDYIPTPNAISPSPGIRDMLLRSVHSSLVFLGDLSRYREGDEQDSPKNWGPAIGFYNLAKKLVPELGSPHNQLAVIAKIGHSAFSFTYHLYRAVTVAEPFPESAKNIEIGVNKILDGKVKGNSVDGITRKEEKPVAGLLDEFLTIHANYAKGKELPDQDAVQTEMIWQLVSDLRERNLSTGMLNKLVFINIAAEYYYRIVAPEKNACARSLMKLNVETFNNLLLVFQPQLERMKDGSESTVDRLTAVGRRMLPALRLYSRWLLNNHEAIIKSMGRSMQLKQLWQTYADTLSILSSSFAIETLPHLEYPLEEDEEMVGFLPLVQKHAQFAWEPFLGEDTSYRVHPNEEMLARVLALLEDCEELCARPSIPITIVNGLITYQEEGNAGFTPSIGSQHHGAVEFNQNGLAGAFKTISTNTLNGSGIEANAGSVTISETGSYSLSARLDRMVDSLVGPRDDPIFENDEEDEELPELPVINPNHQADGAYDDDDEEEIVFVSRNARLSSDGRTPQHTPALKQHSSPAIPPPPPPPVPNQVNVNDLVNYVTTFSQRMEASSPALPPASPSANWGSLAPSPIVQQLQHQHIPSSNYNTLSSLFYPPSSPVTQRRINSPIFASPWSQQSNSTPPPGQGQYHQGRG